MLRPVILVLLGGFAAASAGMNAALGTMGQPMIFGLGCLAIILGLRALALALGRVLAARLRPGKQPPAKPVIVVDGSNVMHWRDDRPSVRTLALVLDDLTARGYAPHVFFDANVGYKLFGRAIEHGELADQLELSAAQITLAPSRTPADPLLIGFAIRAGVQVVSNDRFMDWRAAFPQIGEKAFLVKGRIRGEAVELRLN